MCFVIIGKSLSGKTTIARLLREKGYVWEKTYTTRPRRDREPDDEYVFVSDVMFSDMACHDEFMSVKGYETVHGNWLYGTPWPSSTWDKNTFVIMTPLEYAEHKNELPDGVKCLYIYANNNTIMKRMKKRGDIEESMRRFKQDNKDFLKAYDIADHIFYNNINADPEEIADEIDKWIESNT